MGGTLVESLNPEVHLGGSTQQRPFDCNAEHGGGRSIASVGESNSANVKASSCKEGANHAAGMGEAPVMGNSLFAGTSIHSTRVDSCHHP